MSTTQTDRLRALLEPLAAEAGLDLEAVTVTQAGSRRQVQIDVDADGGVDLDAIAEFSRHVGQVLDESDLMGAAPYLLEVGSPGAERPLSEPRHWRRAEGRLAKVHLTDGKEIVARVLESDEDGVLVEVQPVKGRGRPKERRLAWAEIDRARVQVEFNRKDDELLDAAEDLVDDADDADTDGADFEDDDASAGADEGADR
ncbi:ribosome maturation factor RimP [Kitasatospora sp. NPDC094015]|uniref:ribosome maturation factor RimP n=1 Tax=Kitasatospora sp. NPDC094015 TaxID=3155205 RepID=UPI0033201609